MLIDGPIEATSRTVKASQSWTRLRRCSSTAPLKQRPPADGRALPGSTPSMLIDGPIEAGDSAFEPVRVRPATPSMLIDGPIEAVLEGPR